MRNLCVDDLSKSTPVSQSAISFIKAVTKMCKADRFKLVFKSLNEDQRSKFVKDADLGTGELPDKRALGVQWNIDDDTFGFKIAAEEKPLTRRMLLSTLSSVYDPLSLAAPFIQEGWKIIQKLCKENSASYEVIPVRSKDEWNI